MPKQGLRQKNRDFLYALSRADKDMYDRVITRSFVDLLRYIPAPCVSVYNPMPIEVDCAAIIEALYDQGKQVCFPSRLHSEASQLIFKALTREEYDASSKTDFFISGVHPIVSPDVIVMPMIGFHPFGYRLGYGGGYYDQALYDLRRQKQVTAIGLAYSFTENTVPFFESHDEKLDIIITEKQVIKLS